MAATHQLAQLIDGIKAANGWSDPDLVRNAKEKGHVLSKSNISRYRNPLVSIKGEIIHALAAGLRVKPSQVAIAAIESMGIALPSYDAIAPEQAVELDIHLSARDKSVVLGLLRDLRSSAQPRAPDETPEDQEEGRVIDVAFPPEHDPTLPPDINEVGVAAQQGQSEGRRLREQQDRDAEQGEAGDDED